MGSTSETRSLESKPDIMEPCCSGKDSRPLLFTTPTGQVLELTAADYCSMLPSTPPIQAMGASSPVMRSLTLPNRSPLGNLDGSTEQGKFVSVDLPDSHEPLRGHVRVGSCEASRPYVEIIDPKDIDSRRFKEHSPDRGRKRCDSQRSSNIVRAATLKVSMVYNEYGELVNAEAARHQQTPDELTVTQLLRVIQKAYRHQFREKLGKIVHLEMDIQESGDTTNDGTLLFKEHLSLWRFRKPSPRLSPSETTGLVVYEGPPRLLEIGCGDGSWCFRVKKEHPDWIVEGVDDTDHWMCVNKDVPLRDFMEPVTGGDPDNYFATVKSTRQTPEFSVRNINSLLSHERPIPHNLYSIIRGRGLFDRVESYKSFLEDVRSILQPDGVVEFIEVDPRPRSSHIIREPEKKQEHKSGPSTDWTDKILDRFKDPKDDGLATTVPAWSGRVDARLKAALRPCYGVAAANLRSWLEGSGFWDVTESVIRLPVGGDSASGQLLKQYQLYRVSLEDQVHKLRDDLPKIELDALEGGNFHLNLHVVTGRKPQDPRPGDLLRNGSRQEMTPMVYDAMYRFHNLKNSHWERFDFHEKLPDQIMGNMTLSLGKARNAAFLTCCEKTGYEQVMA